MTYSNDDKLKSVRRELAFRRRVYARREEQGAMTKAQADREIGIFEAIEADYLALAEKERLI